MQILCKLFLTFGLVNTNIVISLDQRRAKKDGSFPVVMRLGHNERTTSIQTGVSVSAKDWDAKNSTVKKSYTGVSSVNRLNNILSKKKADAMDIIFKLDEEGVLSAMPIAALRKEIDKSKSATGSSFFDFANVQIEALVASHQIGTARSYKGVCNVLRTFRNGKDLSFQEITYDFLRKFEASHLGKGNSYNGLSVYLRAIRAIYNKAIKSKVIDKSLYPFTDYKIKEVPTEKRALNWDLLKIVIELDLSQDHSCFHARNYFLASYMMYGMNFIDMAFLKKSDIKNGRVQYRRQKTAKLYDIKISDSLEHILSFYKDLNPASDFIFPIIKRDTPLLQSKDIQWARKRYNKKLKELAALCGIEKILTSYVSRHSFATQAQTLNIPIKAISTMLGHSDLKTTEIYLESLPTNVLDDFNEQILKG